MQEFDILLFLEFISGNYFIMACLSLVVMGVVGMLFTWPDRKLPKIPPEKTDAKDSAESGSVFFALFAAVSMVGVLAASTSNILRGPVTTMSEITRRTVAENAMMAAARLSVVMSGTAQPSAGDCDADGTVEPINDGQRCQFNSWGPNWSCIAPLSGWPG
jgi:Na+/H+ antiporter NhaD/arsenite permease-like protein